MSIVSIAFENYEIFIINVENTTTTEVAAATTSGGTTTPGSEDIDIDTTLTTEITPSDGNSFTDKTIATLSDGTEIEASDDKIEIPAGTFGVSAAETPTSVTVSEDQD